MRIRVAAVAPALVVGDVEGNLTRVDDLVRAAAGTHRPDLIVLPAGFTGPATGRTTRPIDGAPFVLLRELARELGCVVAGGALFLRGRDVYATYLALEPDGRAHLHDQAVLSAVEARYCRRGDDDGVTTIHAWGRRRVGLAGGREWSDPGTARRLRAAGVELVVGGGPVGAALMARQVGAPVVTAVPVGGGETTICAADGTALATLSGTEGHIVAIVDLGSRPAAASAPTGTAGRHLVASLTYRANRALRRFPWQDIPATDVPDEVGPRRRSRVMLPPPRATIPAIVQDLRVVAEDVVGLTLAAKDGNPLPTWSPGAHIDLVLDEQTVRQYSLCGDPGADTYEIAVLREPAGRGGSVRVHSLQVGDEVGVRGPRNHFGYTAPPPGSAVLFLAGGIGITPLLGMVREAAAAGADWRLIYTARSADRLAFHDDLMALSSSAHGRGRIELRSDAADGLLSLEDLTADLPQTTHVYACGPAGMLDALEELCAKHDLRLRTEHFTAAVVETDTDVEFELVAATSGVTVRVPAHTTAMRAVRDAGIAVDSSCQAGVCGSCQVRVLAGTPDQRDTITTRKGQETDSVMMLCVSRARTGSITVEL